MVLKRKQESNSCLKFMNDVNDYKCEMPKVLCNYFVFMPVHDVCFVCCLVSESIIHSSGWARDNVSGRHAAVPTSKRHTRPTKRKPNSNFVGAHCFIQLNRQSPLVPQA